MIRTATGAAKRNARQEICKLRVQSTPEEIELFHEFLERCTQLGLIEVLNFSDIFANKGTEKYYRAYTDVVIRREADHE